ncbi:hypothetical protein GCM10007905_15280 [Mixta theicola]|nr:hypothetical protein GCM10007905_15280 [Mixta theicola]
MRELKNNEILSVTGAYTNNIVANFVEGITCSIGSWSLATLGGRGALPVPI